MQPIQVFTLSELRLFIRTIYLALDAVSRNITLVNLRLVMRRMPLFSCEQVKVSSEFFALTNMQRILYRDLRTWRLRWEA